jgi:LysR family hydrogen peroxide-inducible transcriptional activator
MKNLAPHPMTLRQLQYLVALADTRSFRRAAEHCHVSQPSLSTQVAQVEHALGAQLFERDRRRVLLTAAGAALIERARKLLLDADDLVEVAARFADPLAGTMRVGLIPTVSPYLLPEVAPALAHKLPRLHLVWSEDKTAQLAQIASCWRSAMHIRWPGARGRSRRAISTPWS